MNRQSKTPVTQRDNPDITWHGSFSLEQRDAMIREAAYYRYEQRGYGDGHDIEDWLAAEAGLDRGAPAPAESLVENEVQQSGAYGAAEDDELKRILKQHPNKAIPQVESIEPQDAPLKQ